MGLHGSAGALDVAVHLRDERLGGAEAPLAPQPLQEIESQSGAVLHAGTLYRALARLLESRLIDEIDAPAAAGTADERRRYYRLTDRGIAVARAETQRLEAQLAAARSRRLLRARS